MEEKWKDIQGYENLYQISNLGRVKSLKRTVIRKHNSILNLKERILKQQNMNGYKFVRLSKNNKTKQHLVHRLVATHFIDNPNKYKEINHKDENKENNVWYNLEWCTHKYNINFGTGNERRKNTEIRTKRGDDFCSSIKIVFK